MAEQAELDSWLKRLGKDLSDRQKVIKRFDDYYSGRQQLAYATEKFRTVFGNMFIKRPFRANYCPLVIDAVEERLNIEGFRNSGESDDEQADKDAWRIWQANGLDAESQTAHVEALIKGEAFGLVWADPDDSKTPLITIEDPNEMILAVSASNRRRRTAAFKRWRDEDDFLYATLYLPDGIYKFTAARKYKSAADFSRVKWNRREVDGEAWPLPNPLKVVPVVSLPNRSRLSGVTKSEIDEVIPLQDAINKEYVDMLVASEYAAYRQRYVTGIELAEDDQGNPIVPPGLQSGADRMMHANSAGKHEAKFGEFNASDLNNYVHAIERLVWDLAVLTRTPPHYFAGGMSQLPSGESLKSAEAGLINKVRRRMRHFGEGWEEIMRVSFAVLEPSDPRAKNRMSEVIWRDPESRTESQHVDAVMKMKDLGIPQRALWEELGFTPQQCDRFEMMQEADALRVASAFDPFGAAQRTPPTPQPNAGEPQSS